MVSDSITTRHHPVQRLIRLALCPFDLNPAGMQPAPRPSRTHNRPHAEKVAVLWQCPHCFGWNVTAHTIAAIQRAWVAGSRAAPLRAPCRVGGAGINGLRPCRPDEATTGFRSRNTGSRGGLTTVRLVGRFNGLPEAAVSLTNPRQVQRLRDVAEAATFGVAEGVAVLEMEMDDGTPITARMGTETLAQRWMDWWSASGQGGRSDRPQPWRRWQTITQQAEAEASEPEVSE